MKHTILFMRHFSLAWKYSDYNQLSFEELRNLWLCIWEYHINTEIKYPNNFDISLPCYTSCQSRTYETAQVLGFKSIHKMGCLRELYFDLWLLMTEKNNSEWGMLKNVRIALWKWFFARNPGVESPESVMIRIKKMLREIKQNSERNIAIITHWFFLQLVQCFLIKKIDFRNITYEDFINLNIEPIHFWEKFIIDI